MADPDVEIFEGSFDFKDIRAGDVYYNLRDEMTRVVLAVHLSEHGIRMFEYLLILADGQTLFGSGLTNNRSIPDMILIKMGDGA